MDDYAFLEEVGRFVADKGKLLHEPLSSAMGSKGKGKPRNQAKEPEWVTRAKQAGIQVVFLREGMERRKLNTSRYVKG